MGFGHASMYFNLVTSRCGAVPAGIAETFTAALGYFGSVVLGDDNLCEVRILLIVVLASTIITYNVTGVESAFLAKKVTIQTVRMVAEVIHDQTATTDEMPVPEQTATTDEMPVP